jgi:DNA-binding response OmpR family regulator
MPRRPDAHPEDISVLLVEDNDDERQQLVEALSAQGFTVAGVDDGRKAVDLLTQSTVPFDLLLLNYVTPGVGGYQTLERLKELGIIDLLPIIVTGRQDEVEALVRCIEIGADDYIRKPIDPTLLRLRIQAALARYQIEETGRTYLRQVQREKQLADDLLNVVIPIGVALSAEKDFSRLLEMILLEAKRLCNADGGTLYLRTSDDQLKFVVIHNDTLEMRMGGTNAMDEIPFPPLWMYEEGTRHPNHRNVATHVALTGETLNLADVYSELDEFDFSGTMAFDQASNYHSTSFLTTPLQHADGRVIGVLQLINAMDPESGEVIPFASTFQQLIESLAALAAVALVAYQREAGLREQIEALQIEIDEVKRQREVSEVAQTEHFRTLKEKARSIRQAAEREDS